jgi:serine/threonine protein kinase
MLHAQLEDTPVPVVTLDPNFDPELSNIIDQMLRKEPGERFASLSEVRKRMEAAAIRIQLEASLKRRSALSSGTLPTLRLHEEASVTGSSTPDSGRLAARSHSSPKAQSSSGSQSPLQASSQLVLREPNLALRIGLIVAGLIITTIVLLVLIRTSR